MDITYILSVIVTVTILYVGWDIVYGAIGKKSVNNATSIDPKPKISVKKKKKKKKKATTNGNTSIAVAQSEITAGKNSDVSSNDVDSAQQSVKQVQQTVKQSINTIAKVEEIDTAKENVSDDDETGGLSLTEQLAQLKPKKGPVYIGKGPTIPPTSAEDSENVEFEEDMVVEDDDGWEIVTEKKHHRKPTATAGSTDDWEAQELKRRQEKNRLKNQRRREKRELVREAQRQAL